jgi:hypothetical protein
MSSLKWHLVWVWSVQNLFHEFVVCFNNVKHEMSWVKWYLALFSQSLEHSLRKNTCNLCLVERGVLSWEGCARFLDPQLVFGNGLFWHMAGKDKHFPQKHKRTEMKKEGKRNGYHTKCGIPFCGTIAKH